MTFNYEGSGDELVFLMGDNAEAHPALVEHTEDDSFILHWENNLPEKMVFISEGTLDEFHFYSNDELTRMSMAHFARSGNTPTSLAAAMTNEDNTVTVQLYDNLGDHNSTSAWYILDRFTAKGTNLMSGEEIDLLEHLNPPAVEDETPAEEDDIPAEGEQPSVEGEDLPTEEDIPTTDELPGEDIPAEDSPVEDTDIQP